MEKITSKNALDDNVQAINTRKLNNILATLSKTLTAKIAAVLDSFKSIVKPRFREKLSTLTISQWFYFIASICLLLFVDDLDGENNGLYLVGILAGIGMIREFLHLFHQVWQKILGKGLILVLYAGTANFAFAVSAIKINAIAGIEPSPFIFTLGFTTLIMLPFWLTVATAIFFSIALICINFWILISILLRLVKINIKFHWEDRSFVFFTMVLRMILIPIVIITLGSIIKPYFQQIAMFNEAVAIFDTGEFSEEQMEQIERVSEEEVLALVEKFQIQNTQQEQENNKASSANDESSPTNESETSQRHQAGYLDIMVATFIYRFEAYPYSMCVKLPTQRSLIIDENLMLLVEKDDSDLGFRFSVQECVPREEYHHQLVR